MRIFDKVFIFSENNKVSHYIINNKGNHYKIGEQTFADIPSIINFYKNHFLDTTTLTGAVSMNCGDDVHIYYRHF